MICKSRSIAKDYDGDYGIEALASSAADGPNQSFGPEALGNFVSNSRTVPMVETGVNPLLPSSRSA